MSAAAPAASMTRISSVVIKAAPSVLRSLGPEVYSNPEDSGLVGSAGQSSWRFEAAQPGSGRLLGRITVPAQPKLLIGYSDITSLHGLRDRLGLPSVA